MASNVVADVRRLATAALKSGHALHGVVQPPSKWASAAGHNGSAASPLRKFMARDSDNGVGRSGRYGTQDAAGMIAVLDEAEKYHAAKTEAQQSAARKSVRRALDKNRVRQAQARGAKTTRRKAKATSEAA